MPIQTSFSIISIKSGLATLPQELYDEVFDLVFTAPVEPVRDLSSPDLRTHLNLLHVSHATREQYATSYYTAAFIIEKAKNIPDFIPVSHVQADIRCNDSSVLEWLSVLPKSHRDLVKRITISGDQRDALEAPPTRSIGYFSLSKWGSKQLVGEEFYGRLFLRVVDYHHSYWPQD